MIGQEQSGGMLRLRPEFRHIPPAVKHFPPVVVDCLQLYPPCPGPLSAVQGWLAAEILSCFQSILSLMESRGQHSPHPFSVHTPLRAARPQQTHRQAKNHHCQTQAHIHTGWQSGMCSFPVPSYVQWVVLFKIFLIIFYIILMIFKPIPVKKKKIPHYLVLFHAFREMMIK